MKKILVINAGSSSVKFEVLAANNFTQLGKGIVDGINLATCETRLETSTAKFADTAKVKDHTAAVKKTLNILMNHKIINDLKEIIVIGHRVVHGGEKYQDATIITSKVMKALAALNELAPLHNPHNLKGIEACQEIFKQTPQVAIFDTAFHATLPEEAYRYAIPAELYKKHSIRRYGFHGTNHKYVSQEASKVLGKQPAKLITCHLGNGASICAIQKGKSIDTSMGFTPLEGLVMGTRSGDIDPAIIFALNRQGYDLTKIETTLMKESGLKGLSEVSSDMRLIWAEVKKGNTKAKLALKIYNYRIAKYIASYAAALNGLDALVFTGGIGEKAEYVRADICKHLKFLGLSLDGSKNKKHSTMIQNKKSKIKVLIIPANEEKQIAKEALAKIKH